MEVSIAAETMAEALRDHYDRFASLSQVVWGPHLHHGLFERDASPITAQLQLIHFLIDQSKLSRGTRVLDAGCGTGGSALWLAQHLQCRVQAVTISPVEAAMIRHEAQRKKLSERVEPQISDLENMRWPRGLFDAVWAVESTEHLANKAAFIRNASVALVPGGKLILSTVIAVQPEAPDKLLDGLRDGLLWPNLATVGNYQAWCREGGLVLERVEDLSAKVAPTWDWACRILERKPIQRIANAAETREQRFAESFPCMREAFARHKLRYIALTAAKPLAQ